MCALYERTVWVETRFPLGMSCWYYSAEISTIDLLFQNRDGGVNELIEIYMNVCIGTSSSSIYKAVRVVTKIITFYFYSTR